ncbi:esterase/lipase family protein [Nocardia sp. alder85J]|uniref:esterase/lipase family protein n=1 Tax=Nocardia sp. alder85J TaxID=2862949 RepID=UPI001CD819AF|nr:alpha/beta fold hydrolase [Nocardia sp. alder85J]MCX4091780.1 alpha/beta fold hydrolase [Nocardia sp. alder85J]
MRRATTILLTVSALSGLFACGPAQARPEYPVPYGYAAGVAAQLAHPGTAPPGADDWSCAPSAAHPNPVVLLHGFFSSDTVTWQSVAPALADAGYCVFTTTYGRTVSGDFGGMARVEDSAAEIAGFIDRVRAATGAEKVDLVGHSAGAAIPFYYVNHLGGAAAIDHYVGLAAPYHGSTLSGLQEVARHAPDLPWTAAACGNCAQLVTGAPFLAELHADAAAAPDIRFTDIITRDDEVATPYTTGLLTGPNVRNIVVQDQCPGDVSDHFQLPGDPAVVEDVLEALDETRPHATIC